MGEKRVYFGSLRRLVRILPRACKHCRKVFTPKRKDKVYCSTSCKTMGWQKRNLDTCREWKTKQRARLVPPKKRWKTEAEFIAEVGDWREGW
mgnify:CR=1 FL=1